MIFNVIQQPPSYPADWCCLYLVRKISMRVSTEEEMKIFDSFDKELTILYKDIEPLKEIVATSNQALQIISFHLVFEYLIEKWIDCKINKRASVFRGIEKIGFHNKLYMAKNIGLPKTLFSLMEKINEERNKFAHQITKKEIQQKDIIKIGELSNNVVCTGARYEELGIPVESGGYAYFSATKCEKILLHIVLHASLEKLKNFIFMDIHHSTSRELPSKKSFKADAVPARP